MCVCGGGGSSYRDSEAHSPCVCVGVVLPGQRGPQSVCVWGGGSSYRDSEAHSPCVCVWGGGGRPTGTARPTVPLLTFE